MSEVGPRLTSLAGLACMILIAWALSEKRRAISWRLIAWAVGLQFAIGAILLSTWMRAKVFTAMDVAVSVLTDASQEGANMVFGELTAQAVFMCQVLPTIILITAISAILFHLRVIQAVVRVIAWIMARTLKISGAETFGAALLIFLGIESVSAIQGYLGKMTRSELCVLMTTFMATIAGSVLVVYTGFGAEAGHLLTASLMSAPAAVLMSKLLVPETEEPETGNKMHIEVPVESRNVIDAAVKGTSDGLHMALTVGATIIVFLGLVYLFDTGLQSITKLVSGSETGLSFSTIMGYVFRPFAYVMGVPREDVVQVASLLGTKTVLNEFIAYMNLKPLIDSGALSPRGVTIATYALCGFANPGSMGIVVAGLIRLIPERRADITSLAVRSFIGGTLACFATACVAGVLVYA